MVAIQVGTCEGSTLGVSARCAILYLEALAVVFADVFVLLSCLDFVN
jgi:hypothetical protein